MILDCDGVLIDGEVVALTNTHTQKEIAAHQPKDGAQKTLSCRFGRGGARIIRNCPDSSLVWVLTGRRWQSPPPRVRSVTQNPDCKGGVSYPLTPETLLTFARSADRAIAMLKEANPLADDLVSKEPSPLGKRSPRPVGRLIQSGCPRLRRRHRGLPQWWRFVRAVVVRSEPRELLWQWLPRHGQWSRGLRQAGIEAAYGFANVLER